MWKCPTKISFQQFRPGWFGRGWWWKAESWWVVEGSSNLTSPWIWRQSCRRAYWRGRLQMRIDCCRWLKARCRRCTKAWSASLTLGRMHWAWKRTQPGCRTQASSIKTKKDVATFLHFFPLWSFAEDSRCHLGSSSIQVVLAKERESLMPHCTLRQPSIQLSVILFAKIKGCDITSPHPEHLYTSDRVSGSYK